MAVVWSTLIPPIIGSVSALVGVFAGEWLSFRRVREELLEKRRTRLSDALSNFVFQSNESHTKLLEQVFESESSTIEMLGKGLDAMERNIRYQAEANRMTAFINRYLGDLRGQSLGLRLATNDVDLLNSLDRFDGAIAEAFQELEEIGNIQASEGEKYARAFSELAKEYQKLHEARPPVNESKVVQLDARNHQLTKALDRSFENWRSNLLHAAVNFRTDREVANVVEVGRGAVETMKLKRSPRSKHTDKAVETGRKTTD